MRMLLDNFEFQPDGNLGKVVKSSLIGLIHSMTSDL